MLWYERGDVSPLWELAPEEMLCLDVETTGLKAGFDEVLQLALVRGDDLMLMNGLFGTERRKCWPNAQHVHGIAPVDVDGLPSLRMRSSEVSSILSGAKLLIGYNLVFDLAFLKAAGVHIPHIMQFDVMREVAPVIGRRKRHGAGFDWVRLEQCVRHYGVQLHPHDALEDAQATLLCFWRMLEDDDSDIGNAGPISYLDIARRRGRL